MTFEVLLISLEPAVALLGDPISGIPLGNLEKCYFTK